MIIAKLLRFTALLLCYSNLIIIISIISSAIHGKIRFTWPWLIWSYIANLVTLFIAAELKNISRSK
jgi:hypothetical protein